MYVYACIGMIHSVLVCICVANPFCNTNLWSGKPMICVCIYNMIICIYIYILK